MNSKIMFAPFCSATNFYSIICTANKRWEMRQKIIGHLLLEFCYPFSRKCFQTVSNLFFCPYSKRSTTKAWLGVYSKFFWRITELLQKNINQIGYFVYWNECLGKDFLRYGRSIPKNVKKWNNQVGDKGTNTYIVLSWLMTTLTEFLQR